MTEFCTKVRSYETRGIEKSYHLCLDLSSRQRTFSEEKKNGRTNLRSRIKNKIFLLFLFYLLLEEFSFKSFHFIYLFIYLLVIFMQADPVRFKLV